MTWLLVVVVAVIAVACAEERGMRDGGGGGADGGGPGPGNDSGSIIPGTCVEEARWIYVVDNANAFLRFEPDANVLTPIGTLSCPGATDTTPFSMAIDRNAIAWVLYDDGRIFHADLRAGLNCVQSTYVPGQLGFEQFGMGFVADAEGSTAERLFIAGGPAAERGMGRGALGTIDTATMTVAMVGDVGGTPELTGTGAGELWGFFPEVTPPAVRQLDKANGATLRSFDVGVIDFPPIAGGVQSWAFAFWGGRYYIFYKRTMDASTAIWRLTPDTGTVESAMSNTGYRIVGAGVSTCAPFILI